MAMSSVDNTYTTAAMYKAMLTLIESGKLDPSTEEQLRGFLETEDRRLPTLLAIFKVISALHDVEFDKVIEKAAIEGITMYDEDLDDYMSKEQESNWFLNFLGRMRNLMRLNITQKLCESTPLDMDAFKLIWQMFISDAHFETIFRECSLDALTFE